MEIRVYEDETKKRLVDIVHVVDARTVADGGLEQSSMSSLARYAKKLLIAQGTATEVEVERFYYEA